MVNRVVSTKLTEEEHTTLLDACNAKGSTPAAFIKAAILDRLESKEEKPDALQEMLGLGSDKKGDDVKRTSDNSTRRGSELMKLMRQIGSRETRPQVVRTDIGASTV